MQRMIQHIYIIPLFLSMLFSLKSIRLKWPVQYRIFAVLLICVSIVELFALLWKYWLFDIGNQHYSDSNLWLYNSFLIPQYLLYMATYYKVIKSFTIRKAILVTGFFFALFAIFNFFYFQPIDTVNSYTIIFACLIVILLTAAYFEQLIKEKDIIRLTTHPMAWISLGAFIYHTACLPYMITLNYLIANNVSLAVTLFYIYLGLNCIMYSLYSIAYLCQHPLQKY